MQADPRGLCAALAKVGAIERRIPGSCCRRTARPRSYSPPLCEEHANRANENRIARPHRAWSRSSPSTPACSGGSLSETNSCPGSRSLLAHCASEKAPCRCDRCDALAGGSRESRVWFWLVVALWLAARVWCLGGWFACPMVPDRVGLVQCWTADDPRRSR